MAIDSAAIGIDLSNVMMIMMNYYYPVVSKKKVGYVGKRLVVQLFAQRSLKTYGNILIYIETEVSYSPLCLEVSSLPVTRYK